MDKRLIVSDIGGTNGRFAIANFKEGVILPVIEDVSVFSCQDYSNLTELLNAYIGQLGARCPDTAQLAIAGPTGPRKGHVTNLGWHVNSSKVEAETGLKKISFLNDFAALGYATLYMNDQDFLPVTKFRKGMKGGPVSLLGPGTGFGAAMAIPTKPVDGMLRWRVVATEGGHISFSPKTPLEYDLSKHLNETMNYVPVEALLSGSGLQRIHQFLVSYGGSGDASLKPAEITAGAESGSIPSCVRAVQLFLGILGGVAGDIALLHGALGGVYIGGGILPKMRGLIPQSDLLERFTQKGVMTSYLEKIPVHIVASETSALLGAAMAEFD